MSTEDKKIVWNYVDKQGIEEPQQQKFCAFLHIINVVVLIFTSKA